MKSLTFYRWYAQHASGSDSQGEYKSMESFRSTFGVLTKNVKPRSAVSTQKLEVSRHSAFLIDVDFHLKKINTCAAILNYAKDGDPSFQT